MSDSTDMETDKPKTTTSEEMEETCLRYDSLVNCLEKFIQKIRGKPGSCKKLSKAFPALYKSHPDVVTAASEHLWDTFEQNLRAHIMELVNNMKLKSLLCELGKLETSDVGEAWRPTGKPERDSEIHVALSQHSTILQLTEMIQKEESENSVLEDQLCIKETRIKALLSELEQKMEKIEEASALCGQAEGFLREISEKLDSE